MPMLQQLLRACPGYYDDRSFATKPAPVTANPAIEWLNRQQTHIFLRSLQPVTEREIFL